MKARIRRLTCLLFLIGAMNGCATVESVKYVEQIYPPTNPEDIKVFSVDPPREYIEIGEIRVKAPVHDIVQTVEQLREEIAQMGGEAVILRLKETKGIVIRFIPPKNKIIQTIIKE